MVRRSITEKQNLARTTRSANYRESLRLEGIVSDKPLHGTTKAEIIAFYKNKASK